MQTQKKMPKGYRRISLDGNEFWWQMTQTQTDYETRVSHGNLKVIHSGEDGKKRNWSRFQMRLTWEHLRDAVTPGDVESIIRRTLTSGIWSLTMPNSVTVPTIDIATLPTQRREDLANQKLLEAVMSS